MHLRISDDALADLLGIRDYVQPRSPQGYFRVLAAIFAIFDQLEAFPLLGREGEVETTREMTVPRTPYRIIYTLPDQYHIDVERVLHSKLKYPLDEAGPR
ncbi:MAG: type II toxin-antitoxin system RelE/ParE family toxin [Rhizobiaceae bacterium]|nr:type II toxin-antitoxin system RelE/ParE family toxin [Rhizobiaceae bacterium]MBO6725952.1 type II toxin-antitoxin system RelE/ParE family toxin [Rhizobiaceae bacterium]